MAGHLAAMSEFLLRGYNVAIPYVDRGDDILTIEDSDSLIRRIQVKTSKPLGCLRSHCNGCRICRGEAHRLKYTLKAQQLRSPDRNTFLFYMFMWRSEERWSWILIPRMDLKVLRDDAEDRGRARDLASEELTLDIAVDRRTLVPTLWEFPLTPYFNRWSKEWPPLPRTLTDDLPANDPPSRHS